MRENVLVVDEPVVATDLEQILVDLGYNVLAAACTVAEALGRVGKGPLDAAIMDARVGGEPTFAVADGLAARGIPFLIVSVESREALPPRLRERPFLRKPYTVSELVAAVTRLTGLFGPAVHPPMTVDPAIARTLGLYVRRDLELAERHVADGKARIAKVAAIVDRHPMPESGRLLHEMRKSLASMVHHRDQIRRALSER